MKSHLGCYQYNNFNFLIKYYYFLCYTCVDTQKVADVPEAEPAAATVEKEKKPSTAEGEPQTNGEPVKYRQKVRIYIES